MLIDYEKTFGNNAAVKEFWFKFIEFDKRHREGEYNLNHEIIEWLEERNIDYRIAIKYRRPRGHGGLTLFSGFILEFDNTEDEILFKLTWC